MSFHCHLVSIVSVEMSAVSLIVLILKVLCLFKDFCGRVLAIIL